MVSFIHVSLKVKREGKNGDASELHHWNKLFTYFLANWNLPVYNHIGGKTGFQWLKPA